MSALESKSIFPRRYFWPSLTELDYVESGDMELCTDISQRILCLPHYFDLKSEDIGLVCSTIKKAMS